MVRYGKTGLGEALEDLFIMAGIAAEAYPEQGAFSVRNSWRFLAEKALRAPGLIKHTCRDWK